MPGNGGSHSSITHYWVIPCQMSNKIWHRPRTDFFGPNIQRHSIWDSLGHFTVRFWQFFHCFRPISGKSQFWHFSKRRYWMWSCGSFFQPKSIIFGLYTWFKTYFHIFGPTNFFAHFLGNFCPIWPFSPLWLFNYLPYSQNLPRMAHIASRDQQTCVKNFILVFFIICGENGIFLAFFGHFAQTLDFWEEKVTK